MVPAEGWVDREMRIAPSGKSVDSRFGVNFDTVVERRVERLNESIDGTTCLLA